MRKLIIAFIITLISACTTTKYIEVPAPCSCNKEIVEKLEALGNEGVVIREINHKIAICRKHDKVMVNYEAIIDGNYVNRTHCI